ncbi:unnamed protein product, partial [Closterium sp. NIES-53]
PAARQRRRAAGGSRNKNFTEGWVEFARKRDAKRVAALLNGQPMGGKNRSHHRFDLWTIKYLKRFKWDNLSEEMAYRRAVREQKLEAEMRVAGKERDAYVTRVQQSKVLQRRSAKAAKKAKPAAAGAEGGEGAVQQGGQQRVRHYLQRGAIEEGQQQEDGRLMSRDVLGKVSERESCWGRWEWERANGVCEGEEAVYWGWLISCILPQCDVIGSLPSPPLMRTPAAPPVHPPVQPIGTCRACLPVYLSLVFDLSFRSPPFELQVLG